MRTYILVILYILFILALVWVEEVGYQETRKESSPIILTSCDGDALTTTEFCSDSANPDNLIYVSPPVQDKLVEIKVNR